MADILPDVEGDVGVQEVTPVILVDASGAAYRGKSSHAIIDVDLTVPTSGIAAGDLLADTQVVANAAGAIDKPVVVESITLIDPDDTGNAIDLVLLTDNVSLGTENAAPTVSDANALAYCGANVQFTAAGWTDLGGVRVQSVGNLNRVVAPKTGTRDIYIAAVNVSGTAQFAGGTIRARIAVSQDT
jgi:hypothetical protein